MSVPEKVHPSDEVVVLRETVRGLEREMKRLQCSLDASRLKKLKDKVSEHKGNLVAMVSLYRKEHELVVWMSTRERAFKDIFRLEAPFDGETSCRVKVDEPKLFAYFAKYGNPQIAKGETK